MLNGREAKGTSRVAPTVGGCTGHARPRRTARAEAKETSAGGGRGPPAVGAPHRERSGVASTQRALLAK
jgi:hypothetical protein